MRRWLLVALLLLLIPARGEGVPRVLVLSRRAMLYDLGGELGLRFTRQSRGQDHPQVGGGFTHSRDSQHTFEEAVGLRTKGFLYHPRFLVFDLHGEWALQQAREEGAGAGGGATDVFLSNYRVNLTFLQEHPYSVDLRGRRSTSILDAPFTARRVVTNKEEGITVRLKRFRFPTLLSLRHATSGQSGSRASDESHLQGRLESQYFGARNESSAHYEYRREDATRFSEPFLTHELQWEGKARLDPDHGGFATGFARLSRQSGQLNNRQSAFRGSFHWLFSKQVVSDTSLEADKQVIQGRDFLQTTVNTQLRHQLYESLTTTIHLQGQRRFIDEGSETTLLTGLSFGYRKRLPGGGILGLDLNGSRTYNRQQDLAGGGLVVDEAHTVPVEGVVFLEQPGIDPTSLVVTDPTGLIPYVEGRDYDVIVSGTGVLVIALPGGDLRVGRDFVVDYGFVAQPDATFNTLTRGAGASLAFHWGLRLYARGSSTRFELLSGRVSVERLQPSRSSEAGLDFVRGISSTTVRYYVDDNPSSPSRRFQVAEGLRFRLWSTIGVGLGGGWGRSELPDTGDSFQGVNANATLSWRPSASASLELRGRYDAREQIGDKIHDLNLDLEGRLRMRSLFLVATASQEFYDSDQVGARDETILEIKVTRRF